ncbi:MAG TPA: acyltransferase [Candidatus Gemmiger faecigallinarum]|nr:acyltransferase [Candidatus Gemmiger faecigallinarum]
MPAPAAMPSAAARPAAVQKPGRESGLELLRILCMLFIIADHYAGQSGAAVYDTLPHALFFSALGAGSRLGCDIFVVLGAWFLCRQPFRTRRALGLWLSLWLYTVPLTLLCWFIPGSGVGLGTLRWAMFPVSTQQLWFVAQYILLLLLSPALNLLLRAAPRPAMRGLLAAVGVFLVGYPTLFAEDGIFGDWLWSFVFLYLLVGYLRFYPDNRLSRLMQAPAAPWLALAFVAALTAGRGAAQWLGVGGKVMQYLEYYRTALGAAPNLLCALAFFFAFQKLRLGSVGAVNRLASATLGVYVIHQTPAVMGLLWTGLFRTADHAGSAGYALFVIAAVYLGCTAIDLARERLVMRPIRDSRWFAALCRRGDETLGALDKIFPDR